MNREDKTMKNKIRIDFGKNTFRISNIEELKKLKRIKLPEQKPDTFERTTPDINYADDMCGVKFKNKKIAFYPEDIEKSKTMSDKEKINFFINLRRQKRYINLEKDD